MVRGVSSTVVYQIVILKNSCHSLSPIKINITPPLLMRGIDVSKGSALPQDVDAASWYAANVSKAVTAGVIGTDAFRPDEYITREEMCRMLVNGYEYIKGDIKELKKADFTDRNSINDFEAVSKAYSLDLMVGNEDGSFKPENNSTRAEAAAVIARFNRLK